MILVLLLFIQVHSFAVYDDLAVKANDDFLKWCYIPMLQDHRDHQPTQPVSRWTNITFIIPFGVREMQLTSVAPGKKPETLYVSEEIPYYAVNELRSRVYVSITWWGLPWTLYVGWNGTQSNLTKCVTQLTC